MHDATACNDDGTTTVVTATMTGCGRDAMPPFDMTGNVAEWQDRCDGASCRARGGVFGDGSGATCDAFADLPRGGALPNVGFRCCASP